MMTNKDLMPFGERMKIGRKCESRQTCFECRSRDFSLGSDWLNVMPDVIFLSRWVVLGSMTEDMRFTVGRLRP